MEFRDHVSVIDTDCIGSCKSNYHNITTTTTPANTAWVRAQLCKLQKRCTRLAAASENVYQLLAQVR
jgi:hypothetical protein